MSTIDSCDHPYFTIVRKQKFDGSIKSEWQGDLLTSPEQDWLVVFHHFERHHKFANGNRVQAEPLFLHCLNRVAPITVLLQYDRECSFQGAKCDAALPATNVGDTINFIDLDLDVIVEDDFSYHVRDEDTFVQNRAKMQYPELVTQQAHKGIMLAQQLIKSREFPFNQLTIPKLDEKWLKI